MAAPPTLDGLERAIKRVLVERVARIRIIASWKQAAGIEWDEGTERIGTLWIDPMQRGIGWCVMHEVTHYVWRHEQWGELEEGRIEADSNAVWQRIEKSYRRYWWWRRFLAAKLVGGV